jgi:hypothetical protein
MEGTEYLVLRPGPEQGVVLVPRCAPEEQSPATHTPSSVAAKLSKGRPVRVRCVAVVFRTPYCAK